MAPAEWNALSPSRPLLPLLAFLGDEDRPPLRSPRPPPPSCLTPSASNREAPPPGPQDRILALPMVTTVPATLCALGKGFPLCFPDSWV